MVLGLDAAAPATFLALLWPQLKQAGAPLVAVLGAVVAVVLIPVAPAGVPVIAAAFVAVVVGLTPPRQSAATVTS
jgi:predicted branched-subunit amino acid permease